MTYGEYMTWAMYRHKYGPLNPVRMFDSGAAIVASQVSNAFGGKTKPKDFMPYLDTKEPEAEVDAEGFIAALGAGVKHGR